MADTDYSPYAPHDDAAKAPESQEYSRYMPQSESQNAETLETEAKPAKAPASPSEPAPFKSRFQDEPFAITEAGRDYLKETGRWSKFLGIFMLVSSIIMIVFGICAVALSGTDAAKMSGMPAFTLILEGIVMAAMGIIYLFPALYLTRSGRSLKKAFALQDKTELENGLKNVKSFYKFSGIFAIIGLAFIAAAIIAGIIIGIAAAVGIG